MSAQLLELILRDKLLDVSAVAAHQSLHADVSQERQELMRVPTTSHRQIVGLAFYASTMEVHLSPPL